MLTLDEIKALALKAKQNANFAINKPIVAESIDKVPSKEHVDISLPNPGNQVFNTGDRKYQGSGVYKDTSTENTRESNTPEILHGMLPEVKADTLNTENKALDNIPVTNLSGPNLPDEIQDKINSELGLNQEKPEPDINIANLDGTINIQAVLAAEFNSSEDDIELFRKIYVQTGQAVIKLSIIELTDRITQCQKAIKIIEALQQACIRVKKDKLDKETSDERVKRLEAEKNYKIPARRKGVDKFGAAMPVKESAREKLINKFMKSGMSREKAEKLLDED